MSATSSTFPRVGDRVHFPGSPHWSWRVVQVDGSSVIVEPMGSDQGDELLRAAGDALIIEEGAA